ncbi:MAG: tetratricopeptide repeat protein, partial [Candidatus Neomarinimicrobiota bacterium]
ASPGGVCLTEAVAEQVRNKIDGSLELLGEKELKGIKKPVTVYRLVLPWEKEAGFLRLARRALRKPLRACLVQAGVIVLLIAASIVWWWTSQRVPAIKPGEITRLAVLPFANLMNDPQQDYFVDGMHDALLTELSKLGALTVISRQSVMRYKGSDKSLGEIARELQAHALIEGSVLRAGDDVRINVQLIEAAADRHLWADVFDRKLENVLALHSDVARAIAGEIKVTLTPEEETRLVAARPVNPETYELYLKGMFYMNKGTPESFQRGIAYLNETIENDPEYAPAYAGLAYYYNMQLGFSFLAPGETGPQAKAAAMRALEIDSTIADARAVLAYVLFSYDWDWEAAEKEYIRVFEINPNDVGAHQGYALFLLAMGRFDEAMVEIRRAQELDPLNLMYSTFEGFILFFARQYDLAISQLRKPLEMDPNFVPAHMFLSMCYTAKGLYKEAKAEVQIIEELAGEAYSFPYISVLVSSRSEALEAINTLEKFSGQIYVGGVHYATVYASIGEMDQAFQWLEKAYEQRDNWLQYLKVAPRWDPIRDDPRYADLMRRMNFPE